MFSRKRWVKTFSELAQINCSTLNERPLVNRVMEELAGYTNNLYEDEAGKKIAGSAGNVIADFSGEIRGPRILLSAHLDRVKPGGEIEPVLQGDILKSRGDTVLAADDLAGVTSLFEIMRILRQNNIPHYPLKFIFTVGEESGMLGAKALNKNVLTDCNYGFVLDAEGKAGTVIYKSPCKYKFNAVIKGKSADSGEADSGINAIKISSLAISNMNLGKIDKETSANIGVIRGGIARKIVPDLVELEGEVRSHSPQKLKDQIKEMKNIIDHYTDKFGGEVNYNINQLYGRYQIDQNSSIIKMFERAAASASIDPDYQESNGGSDANIFNKKGLPTVNLGMDLRHIHSKEETLNIKDMKKMQKLLLHLVSPQVRNG